MSLSHLGEVHVIRHGGALLDHDVPVGTHALEGLGDDRTLIPHINHMQRKPTAP